jgi:hypothetical protein
MSFRDKIPIYIKNSEDEKLVELMESNLDSLTDKEKLFLAITLMFPPFVDEYCSLKYLNSLLDSKIAKEAAIWCNYLHSSLPECTRFVEVLWQYKDDPQGVVQYSLAKYYRFTGDFQKSVQLLKTSLTSHRFPHNIYMTWEMDLATKQAVYEEMEPLVMCKTLEDEPEPVDMDTALKEYWDEMILGTRITSSTWKLHKESLLGRKD